MKLIPKNVLYFSLTLLVFLFIADKNIYSQNEGPTTYKIVSLSVIGNKLYDARTIISYSGLKENQEISIPSDETRDAIRKLWNLSLFSNIEIYVDKKFGKEVYIVISVKELPRIEKVEIVGNDKYSESDLKDKIGLVSGQVVSDQKLKDIEYNLTRYYIEEGYSLAEVNVDKFISASNETRIRIKIKEGHKLTVRSIDFVGNRHVKSKELKKAMDNTSEKVWWKFWDGATFDKNKFEDDKKLIVYYYKEKGY